jgi:hypothetical protein
LTDEQTRAVKYVASTARAKSEAAKEGLQRWDLFQAWKGEGKREIL